MCNITVRKWLQTTVLPMGWRHTFMMRYDTTPTAPFIAPFYQYQPDSANPQLVQLWHDLVQRPITVALQEYYPVLKQHQRLGEIFRYHSLPVLVATGIYDVPAPEGKIRCTEGTGSLRIRC